MPTTCPACGAEIATGERVCAQCGTAAPDGAGTDAAQPRNLARIAHIVALVGFLLPWITVSCQGRVIAQVSGLDMAIGRATIRNPFTDVSHVHNGAPNALVAVALALLVASLALGFSLAARRAAVTSAAACAAALLLIGYQVLASAGAAARSRAVPTGEGGTLERSVAESVAVGTGAGFWLTCIALAAAIFFYWRARGGAAAAPGRPRSPPRELRTNGPADPPRP
jgi:hypothetical protein